MVVALSFCGMPSSARTGKLVKIEGKLDGAKYITVPGKRFQPKEDLTEEKMTQIRQLKLNISGLVPRI